MADDMGYGDLQSYNPESKIETPHLARLAKEGRRFTDAHAPAAVCVPTRYGLMTGRYPFRMKLGRGPLLEPNRPTLPSVLKQAGYKTAMIGKWHLGVEHEKNPAANQQLGGGPVDHGFDHFYGIPASLDIPPYYWIHNDRPVAPPSEKISDNNTPGWTRIQGAFWRGGGIAPGYKHIDVLPIIRDRSADYIEAAAKSDIPFFSTSPCPRRTRPWLPTKRFEGKTPVSDYGDFVLMVDDLVGRLLGALDKTKQADETLFIFTSDNGPVWYSQDVEKYKHSSVGPLRGMKGDAWEGGHRMPFIARWPGHIPAGSKSKGSHLPHRHDRHRRRHHRPNTARQRRRRQLQSAACFSRQKNKADSRGDGSPILATLPRHSSGQLETHPRPRQRRFFEAIHCEAQKGEPAGQLYNLKNDLGEKSNLYAKRPKIVKRLTAMLEKYKKENRSTPKINR